ncbi:MAG TPA: hypothetical protein VF544_04090 [Pyrinomonadaceae bacterium]
MGLDDEEKLGWLTQVTPLQAEPRGFAPEQMVRCEECLRANPPTRTACLYCAATLPRTEASALLRQPALRRLEDWESGYSIIFIPQSRRQITEESLRKMTELLRLKMEELLNITGAAEPLPLALAATAEEAALIEERLRALGADTLTIADAEPNQEEAAPKRVRALALEDDALIARTMGDDESIVLAWDDISLLVAGRLFERRVEVEERRGRGSENEIVEARELSADEEVLDIYAGGLKGSARIVAHNFDFSCLGPQKRLVAAENFSKLRETLTARAARAAYDDSYKRLRHALGSVWPLEERTASGGLRRARPGRLNTETVTTSSNERQFTRYSRLRNYLRLRTR